MASAIASTPRQFAAVNCFSGVNKGGQRDEGGETDKERGQRNRNKKETKDTGRLIKRGEWGGEIHSFQSSIKRMQTYKTAKTEKAAAGSTEPQPGFCICLRLRENKYNNSKQLRGQTTRGIDRSQPRREVVDGRERDLGLAGPL